MKSMISLRMAAALLCFVAFSTRSTACTTAIIAGDGAADRRPILFKQRDTDDLDNKLMAFSDGGFDYIGLVNANDTAGKEVWGGFNRAGFAIMNSDSCGMKSRDADENADCAGQIMKWALERCETVKDFETLLDSLPKPLHVGANFGVIDAKGGAAYFETGSSRHTKFDATDKNVAPFGYLVRTNFSYSGDRRRDHGLSRYKAARNLLYEASLTDSLSPRFLLQNVSRSLKHGLTNVDLYDCIPAHSDAPQLYPFRDFIPRYSTASAIVVQGVKAGESPLLTEMDVVLGSPMTTVAVPVWIAPGHALPTLLTADKTGKAKLCSWSLSLKRRLFPVQKGEGEDYIDLAKLLTKDQNGIVQKIVPIENRVLAEAETYRQKWREAGAIDEKEASAFYNWVDEFVADAYQKTFGLHD
jgi:hypothetical protein